MANSYNTYTKRLKKPYNLRRLTQVRTHDVIGLIPALLLNSQVGYMDLILIKAFNNKPWRGPETYQKIESSLKEEFEKVDVITAESREQLESELKNYSGKKDVFVFNIAEYINEEKTSFIPEILEKLDLKHIGSSCETINIGLNKTKSKELFREAGILTPNSILVEEINQRCFDQTEKMGYPLFVKPNFGGGHIGIEDDSIVNNKKQLSNILKKYLFVFKEPILVEKYISEENMREFSVGIIGNENKIVLPIEIDYDNMDVQTKILSGTAAKNDLEKVKLLNGEEELKQELSNMAIQSFDAIKGRDYCRVDIRMNYSGIYLLEINIMPGLGPLSFLPFAAKEIMGLDYKSLIILLTTESIKRSAGGI